MLKKVLATALAGCLGCGCVMAADQVTVNFQAKVVGTACFLKVAKGEKEDVTTGTSSVNVDFSNVKDNQSVTTFQPITFMLTDCGLGVESATVTPSTVVGGTVGGAGKTHMIIVNDTTMNNTGATNIAFYKDKSETSPSPYELTSTNTYLNFETKSELTKKYTLYTRLEKPESVTLGPVEASIVFTAVYK